MSRWLLFTGLLCVGAVNLAHAGEPVDWIPSDVNAVAWVDVVRLSQTPMAKAENWEAKSRQAFFSKTSVIPPGLDNVVLAAELDFTDGLPALQNYGIGKPSAGLTLESMGALTGSRVEQLDGAPALVAPDGLWITQTSDGYWLSSSKGGRQAASRWLKHGPSKTPNNIARVYRERTVVCPIGMVLDLEGTVTVDAARKLVNDIIAENRLKDIPVDAIAETLASVKTVLLEITVDDKIQGRVTVEFAKPAATLGKVSKYLAAAVLSATGAAQPTDTEWAWYIDAHGLNGSGEMTVSEVRRMMSVLRNPLRTVAAPEATAQPPSSEQLMADASLKYYRSIDTLLDDLQAAAKKDHFRQLALLERYADKIDDLPLLNVDDALLDFGRKVSSSLRYQSLTARNANMQAAVARESSGANVVNRVGQYSPFGGWITQDYAGANGEAIDMSSRAGAKEVSISEMKQIKEGLINIRTDMTRKYHVEF